MSMTRIVEKRITGGITVTKAHLADLLSEPDIPDEAKVEIVESLSQQLGQPGSVVIRATWTTS